MLIVLHFTVSDISWDYFQYAKASHCELSDHPENLRYRLYSLDPDCSNRARREPGVIGVEELHGLRGSNAHAAALQVAFSRFENEAINVIADSDAVMLRKGWDTRLKKDFSENGYDMLAITVYEDIGGFSSGVSKYQTYKGLPCLTWSAFSPARSYRDMIDLSPDKDHPMEITTEEQAKTYNLPIGYFLVKDVCWQMPQYFQSKQIKIHLLKPNKPSKTAVVLKGLSDYHDEFVLDSQPFLIHQRGSMNHRFRVDPLSKTFYAAADRYLGNPRWSVKPPLRWTNILNQKWLRRWIRVKTKLGLK